MELFEQRPYERLREACDKIIHVLRVPGGWNIDGLFVPEPPKEPIIFGVPLEMTEDEKLIRNHVIQAQEVLAEWVRPKSPCLGDLNKIALDQLLNILDQSKLVEAIRRTQSE